MHEIAPGIHHWTAPHPKIKMNVSSYWLEAPRVLLDPLDVPDDVEGVTEIVLSNRHHKRDAFEAAERFGAPVCVPRVGLHEFGDDEPVEPYDFEEPFAGGAITAYQVTEYWPDDCALHIPSVSALVIADTVINYGGLRFVPEGGGQHDGGECSEQDGHTEGERHAVPQATVRPPPRRTAFGAWRIQDATLPAPEHGTFATHGPCAQRSSAVSASPAGAEGLRRSPSRWTTRAAKGVITSVAAIRSGCVTFVAR
jgi:hypothetical protein